MLRGWVAIFGACALGASFVGPVTAHASSPIATPILATGVYNSNNFAGASGDGTQSPSDSTGDSSPTQQVEMVNSSVTVFPNPCGGACGLSSRPLYNLVAASFGDCVFDPQVAWDQQWGRWIYVMAVQSSSGGCKGDKNKNITDDRLVVGWTYTSDANDFLNGNYCWEELDRGPNLDDFPKLGHDNNSLVVGANVLSNYGQGGFQYSMVWVVTKPAGVSATNGCGIGGPRFTKTSLGSSVFSPVPAVMTDSSGVDYIVAAQRPGSGTANTLFVWQSSVTAGVTYVGALGVAGYSLPPGVPQPATGTSSCATAGNCLDSGDARLTQAVAHYDPDAGQEAIWTQHTIMDSRVSSRSVLRWYEILPTALTVRQSGNVSDSSLYLFNGAVSPTVAGDEAVIAYNAASSAFDGWVSVRAQSRNRVTPLGQMSNETILASSGSSFTDFTCGVNNTPADGTSCRWGDYAGARPDPANANGVWVFEMLLGSPSAWSTQVAEVTPGCAGVQLYQTGQGGSTVQFTAGAPGGGPTQGIAPPKGCSNPRYQFFLQAPGGAWTVVQAWSSSNVFNWNAAGYRGGTYTIDVWANQYGDSTANAESFALTQWSLPACTTAGVTSNMMSPQPSGTQVTLTASAVCPNPNPQFQFWLLAPGGPWTIARPWSSDATFNWDTTRLPPGTYHFSVWARDTTSGGAFGTAPYSYDAYGTLDFGLQATACPGMSAAATPPATAPVGTFVGISGSATGCSAPLYEFWLRTPDGAWMLVQPYTAKTAHGWDTRGLTPGSYRWSVWARDSSSSAAYDSFSAFDYVLTVEPCTGMGATAVPASTASRGMSVTVTGNATGCPSPQYEFWLKLPNGTWTLARGWSSDSSFTWSTSSNTPGGTYRWSVWARDGSSSASYDQFVAFDYVLT